MIRASFFLVSSKKAFTCLQIQLSKLKYRLKKIYILARKRQLLPMIHQIAKRPSVYRVTNIKNTITILFYSIIYIYIYINETLI